MSNQEGRHKGEGWGEYGDLTPYLKTPRILRGKIEGEIIGELGARNCEEFSVVGEPLRGSSYSVGFYPVGRELSR